MVFTLGLHWQIGIDRNEKDVALALNALGLKMAASQLHEAAGCLHLYPK